MVVGVVVVAALAFGTGCGGDSGTSSSATEGTDSPTSISAADGEEASASSTKAEFIADAEEICATRKKEWGAGFYAYEKQVKKEGVEGDVKESRRIAEGVLEETLLPALHKELEALEALPVPEGNEQQVELILQSLSQAVAAVENKGVAEVVNGQSFGKFQEEAKAFGLNCV